MTQTITNLGTGGAALNGRNGSTAGADSNDAEFLDWPGDNAGNYVYLPGVAGNFLSVPDEAALKLTGNLEIVAHITANPSSTIVAKGGSSNNSQTYRFNVSGTLALTLVTGFTSSSESDNSTAVLPVSAGDPIWVKVTRNATAGETKFFTSNNGTTWTQLGTTVTYTGGTVYSGNEQVQIGQQHTSTNVFTGNVYRVIVRDDIDGAVVLGVDTSQMTTGSAASFLANTGQTVTINRSTAGRKSVAVVSPVWLFGTDDFMEVELSDLLEVDASQDFSIVAIVRTWDTPLSSQAIISKRRSAAAATAGNPGYWVRNAGTAQTKNLILDDGTTIRALSATGGAAGVMETVAWSMSRSPVERLAYLNGVQVNSQTTSLTGSLVDKAANFTIGRRANTNTIFADMELVGVAFFRRVLSAGEMKLIGDYYGSRLS
jgi:hypothetical protein